MRRADPAAYPRVSASALGAVVLFIVYALTLAPDVTFWDAGEFIAAAHSLGIPHPPGTPLFVLLLSAWTKLVPLPFAIATNVLSAVATALAAGITGRFVQRATGSSSMAFAAAIAAGGMSSVWLNATETEVYAASLALGVLMLHAGERAGREQSARWTYLTAYLIALAVPLHLSALVAAPAAIALASHTSSGILWRRATMLSGVFVFAMGVGRMSLWVVASGLVVIMMSALRLMRDKSSVTTSPVSRVSTSDESRVTRLHMSHGPRRDAALVILTAAVAMLATTALAFLYLRAQFDPAINQGDPETLTGLVDMVARRQYDVAPMWPRKAPVWVQIGNLGQYVDWQVALSFGPTVFPSVFRSVFTVLFLVLGYQGAVAHWRADRRTWIGVATLLLCGSIGVLVYLNLHAGPSIGYGILPSSAVREARERDYFFVFAFWAWGIWAGMGAVSVAERWSRPALTGALVACLPIVLNWRAVTRRVEPERSLPRVLAEAILESTPPNGVLFSMGDNDSYPLWYVQQVLRVRPDVAVVTVPLLPTQWYRNQIAKRFGLLDSRATQHFDGSLSTAARIASGARAVERPIAVSMQMTAAERARLGSSWTASGLVYVESSRLSALGPRQDEQRLPRAESRQPTAGIDTVAARRMGDWVERRLGTRPPRAAIDPVHGYFRRMLDCPRSLLEVARNADSPRLDSACNYR